MEPAALSPQLFINRELSQLEFNRRVLAQAQDQGLPLLERLRFLCISSSNLDEFFEVRVAGLKQRAELDPGSTGPDGIGIEALLDAIRAQTLELIRSQYVCLAKEILPALEKEGIVLVPREGWETTDYEWLKWYFQTEIEPVLSPMGLDPARPFPLLQNKSLNFAVQLSGKDAFGRDSELAIVQAPRSLPRVVHLPSRKQPGSFVLLSSIINEFVPLLFKGVEVHGCYPFRVTRNSELFVDDEEVEDLLHAIEGELAHRRYGAAVRLETSTHTPNETCSYLLKQFALTARDHYCVPGPVNLSRLQALYELAARNDLKFPAFIPTALPNYSGVTDLFAQMREADILLHHPFESFTPVLDFLRSAAADESVLAIKQTLYRAGADSPIIDALVSAANAGKDVTAIIELRARFDEEVNITLANRLQEAGVHVVYGVVGYKTHAKMILVVRREKLGIRRYCHLGTGNYHQGTARTYTDYGLLTCDEGISADVHEIFMQLTSLTRTPQLRFLLQAPFTLHYQLLQSIALEVENASRGAPAWIHARMNALTEPQIIEALYRASQAGVKIELIVRGICSLRPGLMGVSENIQVRSVIGRFLEHPRVWVFGNGGEEQIFLSSADWMERNFFRRVEVAVPIRDPSVRRRILSETKLYLEDALDAWVLEESGRYRRRREGLQPEERSKAHSAQSLLLEKYSCRPMT